MTKLCSLTLLMGLALSANHAWAAFSCGDVVSGNVTLTNDIVCNDDGSKPFIVGLAVGADDTTIDLNGHTISCTAAGFQGSCQSTPTYNAQNQPPSPASVGIIGSHQNVHIKGPGTVSGFGTGIRLNVGPGLEVKDVTVTGPAAPLFASNERLFGAGIVIANTTCAGGDAAVVKSNDVSNVAQAIQLFSAQCVTVMDNNIHNNSSKTNNTPGIALMASSNNTVNKNMVHGNGANLPGPNPAGAIQVMNGSTGNTIVNNTVVSNCTNGISAWDGPPVPAGSTLGNTIVHNQARFNSSTDTLGGQCQTLLSDPFFDLNNGNGGANSYNANNQCRTQGPGIPAGVCNPGE
jgi:parallel beta-helix repeat protein